MTTGSSIRQEFHAEGGPQHGAGMVAATKAGGLLFLSAIRGTSRQEGADNSTKAQAQRAWENTKILLSGAGATLDNVAKVTVFFQDLAYRNDFHEVWMEVFPENPPARTAMQVAEASPTPGGGAHFVMDIIAIAP